MADFVNLFASPQIKTIVLLIVVDLVLGVIGGLMKKEFVLGKVASFMKTGILGYVLTFVIVKIIAQAQPTLSWLVTIAYVLVVAALAGSILDALAKFGLPIPKILRK